MQESTPQLTDILLQNPGLSLGAAVLFALLVAGLLVLISLKRPASDEAEDGPVTPPPSMAPPLAPVPERAPPEPPLPVVEPPHHHEDVIITSASEQTEAFIEVTQEQPEPEVFTEVTQEQPEPEVLTEVAQEQPEPEVPTEVAQEQPEPEVPTEVAQEQPEPEVPTEVAQEQPEPEVLTEVAQEQQPEEATPALILASEWSHPTASVAGSPDTRPGLSLEELELPPQTENTPEEAADSLPAAPPATWVEADTDSSHLEEWATGHEDTTAPYLILPNDEMEAELIEEAPLLPPEPVLAPISELDIAAAAKIQRQQDRLQQRRRIMTAKVQLLADQLMELKEGPLGHMQQNMKLLAHRFAPVAWSDCSDTVAKARYHYQEATQLVRLANQLNQESDWPQQRIEMNLERAQNKIQAIETLAEQLDQRYQALVQQYREAKQAWNEQAQQYKNLRQALGENNPREKQLQRVNQELQRLKQYFDPDHLFVPQAFEDKQQTITHMLTLLSHPEGAHATQEESMVGTP